MKKQGFYFLVMLSLVAGLLSLPVTAAVTPVPGTPGIPASTIYSLKVDGQTVFVGSEACFGNVTVETASFCMSGTVSVEVTVSSSFTNYEIRPRRHNITGTKSGNKITFTLSQPLKLEIDVDSLTKLLIFATPMETNVPSPTDPNVIYFGPGTHQPGVIQPQSGKTIYIAPGALVKGRIHAYQVSNVKVMGRGMLDARGYTSKANKIHGMLFDRCSNITVEGIALRTGEWWQSLYLLTDYVTVSHMNLLSFGVNNDGIDIDGTRHVRVNNCFIGCGDDGFGWHALDAVANGEPDTDDCIAEDCVIWNTYAGNGLRVGASMETQNFQNITFRNIDVLRHNGSAIYSDHSDWAWCRNIRFENFTDESSSSTIWIKIAKTSYSNNNGYRDERGHYDGLYFINVTSPGGGISLYGYDDTHLIDNVYFENCSIGSNVIDSLSDITYNSYVRNIHFNQTPAPTSTPTSTPTGPNLALYKTVIVDSEYSTSYPGSNAVDGDISSNASRWISADTTNDHWIEVNLAGTYNVNRVRFWTGYNGYNSPLSNYKIQRWNGTGWVDIVSRTNNTNPEVDEQFSAVSTSMIRLLNSPGNWVKLYEIEVYGSSGGATPTPTPTPAATATPTPTPTPAATPTPTPGGNLFSDDFEDGNSTGWTVVNGSWSVVTDGTKVFKQSSTSGEGLVYAGNSSWTNYTVEAKLKLYNVGANTASGIIARYADGNNYYLLRLHGSGKVQLYKKAGGTFALLQEATQTGAANTWYTLKLVMNGSVLTGYVDGVQKVSVTDSSGASGCIGARTYTQSAAIDDVVVY